MRRELRGIAIALVLVAAMTIVGLVLRSYFGVLRGSVLFLIPVMVAGYQFGVIPALVAAVAGVLWSGYLYFAPQYSLYIARPQEIINLVLFMLVALVVSHLAKAARQQTLIARKREREMSDLYAFSRRLAAAPSAAEIFTAIQHHLANLVQRKVALFGAANPGNEGDAPERVRAEIARIERDQGLDATVADLSGNTWLIRRVSHKTLDFGVVAVDLGNVSGEALATLRQRIDDALADAAATLERLDVASALTKPRCVRKQSSYARR